MPKISIVMPAYNSEKFIGFAIESVINQTFRNWELIIVNDGSRDDTLSIITSYKERDPRIRVINQANHGTGSARNLGAAHSDATAEYIIFFDSDDCWEAYTLQTLLDILEENLQAPAVHGLARIIDEDGRSEMPGPYELNSYNRRGIKGYGLRFWGESEPTCLAVLAVSNVILTPGQILLRKSVLQSVGTFDTNLKNAEDWDLWLRFTCRYDILFVKKVVINYRQHTGNKSKTTGLMQQSIESIYTRFIRNAALTGNQRRVITLGYNWSKWLAACLYFGKARVNLKKNFNLAFVQFRAAVRAIFSLFYGLLKVYKRDLLSRW